MNDLKILLGKRYPIPQIITVNEIAIQNSKFVNAGNHLLVTTESSIFFLKRYSKFQKRKVIAEIKTIDLIRGTILAPNVIYTRSGSSYIIHNDSIYVLYEHVPAKNLRDSEVDIYRYFNILCITQNNLLSCHCDNENYNFKRHINKCEVATGRIAQEIVLSSRDTASHDIEYVNFLSGELKNIKKEFESLNIKTSLVHGDMLMQNILEYPADTFWVIDWEKSRKYIAVIDVLRCVVLTMINSNKNDLGLSKDIFLNYTIFALKKINFNKGELENAMNLFYFHLVTNTDFLERVYIEKQDLVHSRTIEDFIICSWIKENKDELQSRINDNFSIA